MSFSVGQVQALAPAKQMCLSLLLTDGHLDVKESPLGSTASYSKAQRLHTTEQGRLIVANELLVVAEPAKLEDCLSIG